MRGEKAIERLRGWREILRGEKQTRGMRRCLDQRIAHNPKIILLFITQTAEVRKQPMHVQHSHEHTYSNKPQENHMYTGNFLSL